MSKEAIKYLIEMHKFFVKKSPSYMQGTNKLKYYLRYPIAYLKFMRYCYSDYKYFLQSKKQ